jgi:ubiquitin-conjugating enzyme E2 S
MEGPADTPYVGKYFLLRFTFGPDFPTTPPTANFLTKVYHPNVEISNGAICVNTLKRDWKPTHTIKHCLAVIRCLLLEPFPESSLNEEAGKLFMESYNEYYKRTKLHADIHGRTQSIVANNNTSNSDDDANNNNTETNSENMEETRILKNTSHNSSNPAVVIRNNTNNNNDATKKSINPSNNKSNLMKKKSLKRL